MVRKPSLRVKLPVALVMVAALLILVAPAVLSDFSASDWRFFKPVSVPGELSEASLVEVVPDTDVFSNAAPALPDLRVIEETSQQEAPYILLVEKGEQRRATVVVAMQDLGTIPGQHTSFVLDVTQLGTLHNEIEIKTSSDNFQRDVVVEGSDDAESWRTLDEGGQIFDFTISERGFNTRDTRVKYPSSTSRYLRVRIINGELPPLDVQGAVVFFSQQIQPSRTEYPGVMSTPVEDAEESSTELVLDLGSPGFPTNRISLTVGQDNFYRRVRLEGSDDKDSWTLLRQTENIYAFDTPKFVGSQLSISYPESRRRYYRLTIFNEDDPPLAVAGVKASGFLRKLIFSAEPGGSYRLYYGNSDAETPSYELEHIFPYLVTEDLPVAGLGAHTLNPLFAEPTEPQEPFTERYPWLVPTAVAIAALLIGVFLTSLFRQLKGMLPPPPEAG